MKKLLFIILSITFYACEPQPGPTPPTYPDCTTPSYCPGPIEICWDDFILLSNGDREFRGSDNDIIIMRIESGGLAGRTTFNLYPGPQVNWWKGIAIMKPNCQLFSEIYAENQDQFVGPNTIAITDITALEFRKAKLFGEHTGMYRLPLTDLRVFDGKKLNFFWNQD